MIHTQCPFCDRLIQVGSNQRGSLGQCPHCGGKFVIERVVRPGGGSGKPGEGTSSEHRRLARDLRPSRRIHRIARKPYDRVKIPDELITGESRHSLGSILLIGLASIIVAGAVAAWLVLREETPPPEAGVREVMRPQFRPEEPVPESVPETPEKSTPAVVPAEHEGFPGGADTARRTEVHKKVWDRWLQPQSPP